MYKIFTTLAVLTLLLGAWTAKQFPVRNVRLTAYFGESRFDHFHSGIDFADVQEVYPVTEGEVLMYRDRTEDPTQVVFGSGDFVIVGSGDFRTYYFHLQHGSVRRNLGHVTPDMPLGTMGDTGHSTATHLHFAAEDAKRGVMINPLMILPAIEDRSKPHVQAMAVKIKDKVYKVVNGSTLYYKGQMELFVIASDLKPSLDERVYRNAWHIFPAGLSRLTLSTDGQVIRRLDFNRLEPSQEGLTVSGFSFSNTYGMPFNYRMGMFLPSKNQHVFNVQAEDFSGKIVSTSFKINFR